MDFGDKSPVGLRIFRRRSSVEGEEKGAVISASVTAVGAVDEFCS
jgi:hypothetical protein